MSQLDRLIKRYRSEFCTLTHKQRAELERDLIQAVRADGSAKGTDSRDWLRDTFGGGSSQYATRSTLLRAGNVADPLWEYLEAGVISIDRAGQLLRHARKQPGDLTETLRRLLRESCGVPEAPPDRSAECESSTLEQAVADYRLRYNGWSEKQRAQAEARLAELGSEERGTKSDRVDPIPYVASKTGEKVGRIRYRRQLWLAGKLAEPLWERVATGHMGLYTAARALQRAKLSSDPRAEIERAAAGPETKRGRPRRSENKSNRKGATKAKAPTKAKPPAKAKPKIKPQVKAKARRKAPEPASNLGRVKRFRGTVKELARELLIELAAGLEESDITRMLREFEGALLLACEDLSRQVQLARTSERRIQAAERAVGRIGRVRFNWACEVLGLSWTYGRVPNQEKYTREAQTKARRRVTQLHPDLNAGSRHGEQEMHSVLQARTVIETYLSQQT